MKKLVIFDLDGTLLNTIKDLGAAANYALDRNGFHTHSTASYPFFVGNGVRRLIERVLPEDARKKPAVVDTLIISTSQNPTTELTRCSGNCKNKVCNLP